MKSNEAPEKIWVHELSAKELTVPLEEYHIEYVRLDAFVEKACKFLKDKGNEYIAIVDGQLVLRKAIIKDLKNYVKGE